MHGDEGTTVLTTEEELYRSIEHFVATANPATTSFPPVGT